LGDIAIPFRAPRALVSFVQVTPSLGVTLLAVAHRQGHQQHHEHDRNRDNDHDHTGAQRKYDTKGSAQIPVPFLDAQTAVEARRGERSR
jgi:hypothetical protein